MGEDQDQLHQDHHHGAGILDLVLDEDHLGVDATERSRGGALDGGVDGDGGQIPVR